MRKCLDHKTVFCCFLLCKGKRARVCGVGWCEGSSYTAKTPRFLLSKRLGFLLYQWCGDKWFQGEKTIPALESLDFSAAFSLLGFLEGAKWRFPRLAPHVAAVIACISTMGRRAGLPPGEDVWGSHPPCSLSENSGVCSKCQNPVHQIISWGHLETGVCYIQVLLVNPALLVSEFKYFVWWCWHKNIAFTTLHMVWKKKDIEHIVMFWQQVLFGRLYNRDCCFFDDKNLQMNVRKAEESNFSQPGEKKRLFVTHRSCSKCVHLSILKHENA